MIRIPDGCRVVRNGPFTKLLRVTTPFDFVLMKNHHCIVFDAKTVDASTFPHSAITQHQLASLLKCTRDAKRAGYLIWFRTIDTVAFIPAERLKSCARRTSITPDDGIVIGNCQTMDISKLFEKG